MVAFFIISKISFKLPLKWSKKYPEFPSLIGFHFGHESRPPAAQMTHVPTIAGYHSVSHRLNFRFRWQEALNSSTSWRSNGDGAKRGNAWMCNTPPHRTMMTWRRPCRQANLTSMSGLSVPRTIVRKCQQATNFSQPRTVLPRLG